MLRISNKKMIIIILVGIISITFVAIAYWGSSAAKKIIEDKRHNILGLALEIGSYDISFIQAKLKLNDIKIFAAGKEDEDPLASAKSLYVNVSPTNILRGKIYINNIRLKKPTINYIIQKNGFANWSALKLENKDNQAVDKKQKNETGSYQIIIENVEVKDGEINYSNLINGQRLNLSDTDISIENIVAQNDQHELPTKLEITSSINETDGKILIKGRADILNDKISFNIDGDLSETPITTFRSFYEKSIPFVIHDGLVEVSSKAVANRNILNSKHHIKIKKLSVGGSPLADEINRFAISETGPITFDVFVNGDLSSGSFSVSNTLVKNLTDELIKRSIASAPKKILKQLEKDITLQPIRPKNIENKLDKIFKNKK